MDKNPTNEIPHKIPIQMKKFENWKIDSKNFLLHTLNALPELISYIDKNYIYHYVNETYERWFKTTYAECIGRTVPEILGQRAFNIVRPYMEKALKGERQKFELVIPYKTGTRSTETNYLPDFEDGEVKGIYIIVHDVSEYVKIKEELETRERELNQIINAAPALIGHWNKDLINLHANNAYSEYFGKSPDEIKGKHISELLGKSLFEKNRPFLEQALNGIAQTFEREIPLPQGGSKHTIAHYIPEFLNGKSIGIFVVVSDVTSLKLSEQKEKEARKVAEEATGMRDEIMAVVSHDLRNPLSSIILNIDFLIKKNSLESVSIHKLKRMKNSALFMMNLINDMMDIHKIEQGIFNIEQAKRPIPVSSLMKEIYDSQDIIAKEKNITLTMNLPTEDLSLIIDPQSIQRVFQNIIGNAIKFTPPGGLISLKAEIFKDEILFTIEDNGPGINAELLPIIFERYTQARSTSQLGAGLGLAISKEIIRKHGGKIWVESKIGVGTKFKFSLPL